ncbi:hypothetical protein PN487_16435 [Microcystis aeruginosa CS-556/03]|nr:hypothetical protein [Microcystis aeruginosa]MDB9418147.1 hypothetical protein [Microcystis aeruginosa CS-556/03]
MKNRQEYLNALVNFDQPLSSHAKLITCPIELKPLRGNDRHV